MSARGVILLAAGGTGGHLFPAQALARVLRRRGWEVHLATDARAEKYTDDFPATEVHIVPSATIGSKNPLKIARALWTTWSGVRTASRLLDTIKPAAVVGFGGYPTVPPLFAATRRGIPTIVHEQNAVMGRANKALASRVSAIAGGFLKAEGVFADKIVETGNPVREAVLDVADRPYDTPQSSGRLRLLIFGGSQGAHFFSHAVPDAIRLLPDDLRQRLGVTQQARAEDEADVIKAYAEIGVKAEVSPFFSDMAERISAAHLVVSRAGASTVLELSVIGRPAILVPLPHALDDDQGHNAQILVDAGAARLWRQNDLDPQTLAGELSGLLQHGQALAAMAEAAHGVGRGDAALLLADLTEAIASGQSVREIKRKQSA